MTTTRRRERIEEAIRKSEVEYRKGLLKSWKDQTPTEYHGYNVDDDLYEDLWGDHISSGAARKIKRYLNRPSKFMIIKGMRGLGKSTLANTLVRDMLAEGTIDTAHYRSLPTLFQEFSWRSEAEVDPVKKSSRVDMLVLDDVGAGAGGERATDHQNRSLWSVIDSRWGNVGRYTIMTTNMSVTSTDQGLGLIEFFGPSAWDRIQDDLTMISMNGDSFRDKEAD